MFRLYSGSSINQVWSQIFDDLKCQRGTIDHDGRGGRTREILHAAISLENPHARWMTAREPAINPAFAYAEITWTITGRSDSAFLNYFNSRLPDYAGHGPHYHGAYGKRLRGHFGLDQLKDAGNILRNASDSRQVLLQYWDPFIDLPHADGSPRDNDIPCNIVSLLKVRNGKLDWTQVMRSNDVFRGLPYDVVQFTLLQEIMAGWMDVTIGEYHHISDSLHLYCCDEGVLAGETPAIMKDDLDADLPSLSFDHTIRLFEKVAEGIDFLIDERNCAGAILRRLEKVALPGPYRDFLAIPTAEALRKRGDSTHAEIALKSCFSLSSANRWRRWAARYTKV